MPISRQTTPFPSSVFPKRDCSLERGTSNINNNSRNKRRLYPRSSEWLCESEENIRFIVFSRTPHTGVPRIRTTVLMVRVRTTLLRNIRAVSGSIYGETILVLRVRIGTVSAQQDKCLRWCARVVHSFVQLLAVLYRLLYRAVRLLSYCYCTVKVYKYHPSHAYLRFPVYFLDISGHMCA